MNPAVKSQVIFHAMPTQTPSQVGRARSWPRRDQVCMWVDMSRPMAGNRIRFPSIHLSIVCPSLWKNVRLQPYLILVKVWKGCSQPHKSTRLEKDSKPLPWCFHSTKKESSIGLRPAQQNEETSWSALGLTCLASIPFYSSHSPSLRNKVSRTSFFPLGFCKFNCFEKTVVA